MQDLRRVLVGTRGTHPRCWDQNTSRIQMLRHVYFDTLRLTGSAVAVRCLLEVVVQVVRGVVPAHVVPKRRHAAWTNQ